MKAKILVNTEGLSREEWLKYRRQGIGGSDVAAIAGISPWKDPFSVYMDKIGQVKPSEPSEAMYWGTTLENVVISEFEKRSGMTVEPLPAILQHPEVPYLLANVDGVVVDEEGNKGIFEAKTANAFSKCEWDGDKVPEGYMLQVQHYLSVVGGLDFAYVAVLIGGNEFQYKRIERDNDIIRLIMALEINFWEEHVLPKSPPDPTAQSAELLSLLYPGGKQEALILPETSLELVQQFEAYQAAEKEAKNNKEEMAAKIKSLMGDHEVAKVDGYTIKWTPVSSERFDSTAFKKDHPVLAQEYTKTSQSRRFSVKAK